MPRQPRERIHLQLPEEKLELLYSQGDEDAFWELWIRHENDYRRVAVRYCYGNVDAAEKVFEAAEDSLRRNRGYDPKKGRFHTYAKQTLRRKAIDHHRRRTISIVNHDPLTLPDDCDERLSHALWDCFSQLPSEYQSLIDWVYFQRCKRSAAAAELGHSPSWATRAMDAAIRLLQKCLEDKAF